MTSHDNKDLHYDATSRHNNYDSETRRSRGFSVNDILGYPDNSKQVGDGSPTMRANLTPTHTMKRFEKMSLNEDRLRSTNERYIFDRHLARSNDSLFQPQHRDPIVYSSPQGPMIELTHSKIPSSSIEHGSRDLLYHHHLSPFREVRRQHDVYMSSHPRAYHGR